jgi:D-alanine-D-alanine ligase-like ATP-grasp enzyme
MFRSSFVFFGRQAKPKPTLSPVARHTRPFRKLDVCVLASDYADTGSPTASVDGPADSCTPEVWVKRHKNRYNFHHVLIDKRTAYSKVRELATSKKFDVFYNLCDGAKDEARAGVDVIKALEEFNCAYTGASSRGFEPSKIDMKMVLATTDVKYPAFVALYPGDSIPQRCKHLRFPVIVKHKSGYASVGITAKSKCNNMKELREQANIHIAEFKHALVEEFITGREGTVFVCADPASPSGIKVFPPIMMDLGGPGDFAHFDNKWVLNAFQDADTKPKGLPDDDPAMGRIHNMARVAFSQILHGVGYGRCDFRICDRTGDPYFLEINPNCGMLYPPSTGGCYADVMVDLDKDWDHDDFITNQIQCAIRHQQSREPWVQVAYNHVNGKWTGQATRQVPPNTRLFPDSTKIIPLSVKAIYDINSYSAFEAAQGKIVGGPQAAGKKTASGAPAAFNGKVGCLVYRMDGVADTVIPLQHSCEPNLAIENGPTLSIVSKTTIKKNQFLSIDYSTLRDPSMPTFVCNCGAKNCNGRIEAQHLAVREHLPVPKVAVPAPEPALRGKATQGPTLTPPSAPTPSPASPTDRKSDSAKSSDAQVKM